MYEFRTQLKTGETFGRDSFCPLSANRCRCRCQSSINGETLPSLLLLLLGGGGWQEMSRGSFSFIFIWRVLAGVDVAEFEVSARQSHCDGVVATAVGSRHESGREML